METQPTSGGGCWTILMFVVVALLVGFGVFSSSSGAVDIPPTPRESVTFAFSADASTADQQATADIITNRLRALGIMQDIRLIPASSGNPASLIVLLPGGEGFQSTLGVISQRGDFELVDLSGLEPTAYQEAVIWTTHQAASAAVRPAEAQQHPNTNQPFTTILDSIHVRSAEASLNQQWTAFVVQVNFDAVGSDLLGQFSASHIGEPVALVVDGRVLSAPVIQSMIGGEAVITGNFTQAEARQLAAKIGFGVLPVPLELIRIG